jgi:hypothetical protein
MARHWPLAGTRARRRPALPDAPHGRPRRAARTGGPLWARCEFRNAGDARRPYGARMNREYSRPHHRRRDGYAAGVPGGSTCMPYARRGEGGRAHRGRPRGASACSRRKDASVPARSSSMTPSTICVSPRASVARPAQRADHRRHRWYRPNRWSWHRGGIQLHNMRRPVHYQLAGHSRAVRSPDLRTVFKPLESVGLRWLLAVRQIPAA